MKENVRTNLSCRRGRDTGRRARWPLDGSGLGLGGVGWGGVGWGGGRMLQNPRASSRILGLAPVRLPLPAPVSLPILVEFTGALICILDPSSFPGDEPEKGNLVNTAAMAKHRQASGRICRLDSRPGLIGITQRCQLL